MNYPRPLERHSLAISISETEESKSLGFPRWQVNHLTLQIVSALFGQGAGAIFGHDWRDDGVMQAIYGFAQQVRSPIPFDHGRPLLQNLLPWPDRPTLAASELQRSTSLLAVEKQVLPSELEPLLTKDLKTPEARRYVRARALTMMRRKLALSCSAMVCIGGRRSGFQGRYAGIAEEAHLALRLGKPLFICGILGGVSADIIGVLQGAQGIEFKVNDLYQNPPLREFDRETEDDRTASAATLAKDFRTAGVKRLVATNGLTEVENKELFETTVSDRVIQLLLKGLSKIKT